MARKKKASLTPTPEEQPRPVPKEVPFHYIKGGLFRTIHMDGVHGGLTPRGWIQATVFSERLAIPQQVVHAITPHGDIGKEIQRIGKTGLTRELEANLVMSPETATSLINWLQDKLQKLQQIEAKRQVTEKPSRSQNSARQGKRRKSRSSHA